MKSIASLVTGFLLTGCSVAPLNDKPQEKVSEPAASSTIVDRGEYAVETTYKAVSQNERVRFLVLHYTVSNDVDSLRFLTQAETSSHYLVSSLPPVVNGKPVALQLVPEEKRAWHAGVSTWNGRTNINDTSIGIEIVNPGFTEEPGGLRWYPYAKEQIDLLARMAQDIIQRYDITPDSVLGHSDIAPTRKSDPGLLFPWKELAAQGIGAWPNETAVEKFLAGRRATDSTSTLKLQVTLAKYGYQVPQHGALDVETSQVFRAFQLHFNPGGVTGKPDALTESLALALVEKYRE